MTCTVSSCIFLSYYIHHLITYPFNHTSSNTCTPSVTVTPIRHPHLSPLLHPIHLLPITVGVLQQYESIVGPIMRLPQEKVRQVQSLPRTHPTFALTHPIFAVTHKYLSYSITSYITPISYPPAHTLFVSKQDGAPIAIEYGIKAITAALAVAKVSCDMFYHALRINLSS